MDKDIENKKPWKVYIARADDDIEKDVYGLYRWYIEELSLTSSTFVDVNDALLHFEWFATMVGWKRDKDWTWRNYFEEDNKNG